MDRSDFQTFLDLLDAQDKYASPNRWYCSEDGWLKL